MVKRIISMSLLTILLSLLLSACQGAPGAKGPPGEPGARGPAGPAGPPGAQGAVGPKGETGAGLPGPQGLKGLDGAPGKNGIDGKPGAQGPKGDTGPRGEMGPSGLKGDTGPRGEMGPYRPQYILSAPPTITYPAGGKVTVAGGGFNSGSEVTIDVAYVVEGTNTSSGAVTLPKPDSSILVSFILPPNIAKGEYIIKAYQFGLLQAVSMLRVI